MNASVRRLRARVLLIQIRLQVRVDGISDDVVLVVNTFQLVRMQHTVVFSPQSIMWNWGI